MNKYKDNYSEWKKSEEKQYILYNSTCIKLFKNVSKSVVIEGRLVVVLGRVEGGRGAWGRDYEGRDDGYVHYFDRGDGFMNAYMCPNISVAYFECVQFIEY